MKWALLLMLMVNLLKPTLLISQEMTFDQNLTRTGYGLLRESNKLKLIKSDLLDIRKKLLNLDELDGFKLCNISRLIENISLVETICRYEGTILGIFHYVEESQRSDQFKVHLDRLKEQTLKNLYFHYKATQATNAILEDQVIAEFADRAEIEMIAAARLMEEVIKNMQSEKTTKP